MMMMMMILKLGLFHRGQWRGRSVGLVWKTSFKTREERSGQQRRGKRLSHTAAVVCYVTLHCVCRFIHGWCQLCTNSWSVCELIFHFSALTPLVGWHEGHPACKKLGVGLWWWQFDWSFARLIAPVVTTSVVFSSDKSGTGHSGTGQPRSTWNMAVKAEREGN